MNPFPESDMETSSSPMQPEMRIMTENLKQSFQIPSLPRMRGLQAKHGTNNFAHAGTSTLQAMALASNPSNARPVSSQNFPNLPYGAPEPVSEKGERIHADGFGLYPKYGTTCMFITFKDDVTGYTWAFPISNRNSHASRTAFIQVI